MTFKRSLVAFVLTALLAGCGGGSGTPLPSTGTPPGAGGGNQTGNNLQSVKVMLVLPAGSTTATRSTATSRVNARRRDFVSPSTQGLGISVVAHGGTFPAIATPTVAFDVSASSSLCVAGSAGSRTCTLIIPAPAGSDDFQVSGWDQKPVGGSFAAANLLSSTVVSSQMINVGAANVLNYSMGGAVHAIFLHLNEPTLIAGVASSTAALTVQATDADGNVILGFDPFVDQNGNPLTIAINATFLPNGTAGSITLSNSVVTNPSNNTITLNYNGALIDSAIFTATPSSAITGNNASATLNFTLTQAGFNFQGNPVVTTFTPLTTASSPEGIVGTTVGGNALWFTENATKQIGRSTTAGVVTEYAGLTSAPLNIAAGSDGDLYFTETDRLGRINPYTFAINEFTAGLPSGATPLGITPGPVGENAMWFTDPASGAIGTLAFTTGAIAEFPVSGSPSGIVLGPDGNLWVTESAGNAVAQVSTAGTVLNTYPLGAGSAPSGIAVGSDGNLWITEPGTNAIAQVTTAGVVTQFTSGISAGAGLGSIAAGLDGNLWFTESSLGQIGRITTAGVVSEFANGLSPTGNPMGIASGPDGNLWFTESSTNLIGSLEP